MSITALANVALSIALVKPLGLSGVAIGTLVPVSVASIFVLFPAGWQRVHLTVGRTLTEAVWPAVWPAAVMTAYVMLTRDLVGASLIAVGAQIVAAALVYAVTFLFFGVSAVERRFYLSKALALTPRWRVPVASVSEGV